MDPNMVPGLGDFSPTDLGTGTKMGHHAHDHHKHDKDGDGISDDVGIVSPWKHALKQAWHGLLKGAASLGLFGAVFMGVKLLTENASWITNVAEAVMGTGGSAQYVVMGAQAIISGALSGAVWYGGQGAIQAYRDANEHNENFVKRVQDKVRLKQRMQGLGDMVPQFGIITAANNPAQGAMEDVAMVVPVIEEPLPVRETPAFVAAILDKGPTATNRAAEIIADREAAAELANTR